MSSLTVGVSRHPRSIQVKAYQRGGRAAPMITMHHMCTSGSQLRTSTAFPTS